jgi:hypothetical protein
MLSYAHDSYQDVLNAVSDVVDAIVMKDVDSKLKLAWLRAALRDKRTKQRVISALHQIRDCGGIYKSCYRNLNEKASKVARNLILGAW